MFKDDLKKYLEHYVDPDTIEKVNKSYNQRGDWLVCLVVKVWFNQNTTVFEFTHGLDEDGKLFKVTAVERDNHEAKGSHDLINAELALDELIAFSEDADEVHIGYVSGFRGYVPGTRLYNRG